MDFSHIDPGLTVPILGILFLLVAVDTILGAVSAFQGGTFKWEYLYAVVLTKGAALTRVAVLLLAGAVTPFLHFELLGLETDPFTAIGIGFATPLAASLLASIVDNIGKADVTAPQGVAPVDTATPSEKI